MLAAILDFLLAIAPVQESPVPQAPSSPAPAAPAKETKPESAPREEPAKEPAKKPAKKPRASRPSAKAAADGAARPAAKKKAAIAIPAPRPKAPEVPSYKVSVRMKNGRRFIGLVSRDRAFHDLVFSGAHHETAAYARSDRIRLRFVDGLDGELEIGWSQIARLEVRDILDSAGVRAMEDVYAGMRLARETHAPAADPATPDGTEPAPAGADPVGGAAPVEEGSDAPKTEEEKLPDPEEEVSLLTEFSPQAGWSPDRKKQIEWRRTVVGSFPDPREQRFLDVFEEWLPLYEAWQKEMTEEPGGAKPKSDGRVAPVRGSEPSREGAPQNPPAKPSKGAPVKEQGGPRDRP